MINTKSNSREGKWGKDKILIIVYLGQSQLCTVCIITTIVFDC